MFPIFLRPDAIMALEDPKVKKALPRYIKVVKDELPAKFRIAKRIGVEFEEGSEEELWNLHNQALEKFRNVQLEIDNGKLKFKDLKKPKQSLLDLKIELTKKLMECCTLCERLCMVNRWKGEMGECRVGNKCLISSEFVHWGEEAWIVPSHTIFFMGCNFHCQYCQNYTISQWYESGFHISSRELGKRIESRRMAGCRNVNYVGAEPTPSLLWVLESLKYCNKNIPTLWNSNFYMSIKSMQLLDGVMDMYLSDFKYGNDECALRLSKVSKYFEICARNHLLAAKQAEITLRHLILPSHLECCTFQVLEWVAKNLRENCIVNLMEQYRPCWRAHLYPEITRGITKEELMKAVNYAKKLNLNFVT